MTAIKSQAAMRQLLDYAGAQVEGNKSFTDIDAVMEYSDKAYVITEVKRIGAKPPKGQILALTRMARDLGKVKPVLLVLAEHDVPVEQNVMLADCRVRWYMQYLPGQPVPTKKTWQKSNHNRKVMNVVEPWLGSIQ